MSREVVGLGEMAREENGGTCTIIGLCFDCSSLLLYTCELL